MIVAGLGAGGGLWMMDQGPGGRIDAISPNIWLHSSCFELSSVRPRIGGCGRARRRSFLARDASAFVYVSAGAIIPVMRVEKSPSLPWREALKVLKSVTGGAVGTHGLWSDHLNVPLAEGRSDAAHRGARVNSGEGRRGCPSIEQSYVLPPPLKGPDRARHFRNL
jgi:hypothetical protein